MLLTLAAASLNGFFISYRAALFKTVSYDTYEPYLLYILGQPGGEIPISPWVYRIGSVVMAAPFYKLPVMSMNGGGAGEVLAGTETIQYVRATQAICFANYFYLSLACLLVFFYCRNRLKLPDETCFIGAVIMFVLYHLNGPMISVEGLAVLPLVILAITVFERKLLAFSLTVLISASINEKIVMVALLMVGLRLLFWKHDRRFYATATVVTVIALLAYILVVYMLRFPGNENHTDPTTYVDSALRLLKENTFTLKGLYMTVWPILLLVGLWFIGMTVPRSRRLAVGSDLGVVLGMVVIAFGLAVTNIGRIAVYSAAIVTIAATPALAPRSASRNPERAALKRE